MLVSKSKTMLRQRTRHRTLLPRSARTLHPRLEPSPKTTPIAARAHGTRPLDLEKSSSVVSLAQRFVLTFNPFHYSI